MFSNNQIFLHLTELLLIILSVVLTVIFIRYKENNIPKLNRIYKFTILFLILSSIVLFSVHISAVSTYFKMIEQAKSIIYK